MRLQITSDPLATSEEEDGQKYNKADSEQIITTKEEHDNPNATCQQDAFGNEEFAEVKYKILEWWWVFQHCHNHDKD